jgi:hypothetical protein
MPQRGDLPGQNAQRSLGPQPYLSSDRHAFHAGIFEERRIARRVMYKCAFLKRNDLPRPGTLRSPTAFLALRSSALQFFAWDRVPLPPLSTVDVTVLKAIFGHRRPGIPGCPLPGLEPLAMQGLFRAKTVTVYAAFAGLFSTLMQFSRCSREVFKKIPSRGRQRKRRFYNLVLFDPKLAACKSKRGVVYRCISEKKSYQNITDNEHNIIVSERSFPELTTPEIKEIQKRIKKQQEAELKKK